PPVPKARARRGKGGHWYTPTKTRRYERHVSACAFAALVQARRIGRWPKDARYMLRARIYRATNRRMDADNVLKSLADGCIGVFWDDDHGVGFECPPSELDRGNPRVEVEVEVVRATE